MSRVPSYAMPPQDAAWLGMERPTNLMVVTAVLVLDGRLDEQSLRSAVQERIVAPYPSFRRRPVRTRRLWPRVVWADDRAFDVRRHVRTTNLTGPLGTHLDPLVADLMGEPLDPAHPPWLMHLVSDPDGQSALVVRVHHCVGDGIALARVLLALTDPDEPETTTRPTPASQTTSAATVLTTAAKVLAALVRVPLMTGEPRTHLRGRLGTRKAVARGAGVDLACVRHRAGDASVNDAVLAAVAGGLRRELVARGDPPQDLRVLVPVDLRPPGAAVPAGLGNRFGMVFVSLPVAEPDPERRISEAHQRSSRARLSAEALATYVGLTVLGVLPRASQALAVRLLGARATAVVTNVPGPRGVVRLAGRRVRTIAFWVPQTGAVGIGISVFSYAGTISVAVAADARLLPDPTTLVRAIEAELGG